MVPVSERRPQYEEDSYKGLFYIANASQFDSLPDVLVSTPLNIYNLLKFTGIDLKTYYGGDLVGNIPPSKPNFAAYGGLNPTGNQNTVSSLTTCFQLESLYASCGVAPPIGVAIPTACNITLFGYDSDCNYLANQTLVFEPTGPVVSRFGLFNVTQIGKVKTIQFTTTAAVEGLVATAIDNLSYVLYNGTKSCEA